MKLKIYYEFQKAIAPIREQMQIIRWKATLRRMNVILRLMKQKIKELDDTQPQSNSASEFKKTLYVKYNI